MLKLVGKVLSESGVEHLFLHGSIHVVSARIRRFKLNPKIRVVLLSSDRASSGLNLTEASHIVLLDTLNTDRDSARVIEEQAIGRSVRLGQEKRVQVQRFIMRETIEHEFYLRNIGHMVNREVEPHGDTD
jgi:SNF2 family DNA or RNA helicase